MIILWAYLCLLKWIICELKLYVLVTIYNYKIIENAFKCANLRS